MSYDAEAFLDEVATGWQQGGFPVLPHLQTFVVDVLKVALLSVLFPAVLHLHCNLIVVVLGLLIHVFSTIGVVGFILVDEVLCVRSFIFDSFLFLVYDIRGFSRCN